MVLANAQVRPVLGLLDPRTLSAVGEPVSLPEGLSVLLIPDAGARARVRLLRTLSRR